MAVWLADVQGILLRSLGHAPLAQGAPITSATALAAGASVLVAVIAASMAYMGWQAYRATENPRLPFVVLAFGVFVLKSIFTAVNVLTHTVPHDAIEFVGALLDLIIVLLLFMPFFMRSNH